MSVEPCGSIRDAFDYLQSERTLFHKCVMYGDTYVYTHDTEFIFIKKRSLVVSGKNLCAHHKVDKCHLLYATVNKN